MITTAQRLVFIVMLSHFFCCGIPFVMALVNLGSFAGLSFLNMHSIHWFEELELQLLVLSAIILAISWFFYIKARPTHEQVHGCEHDVCSGTKSKAKQTRLLLIISTILLVINGSVLLLH